MTEVTITPENKQETQAEIDAMVAKAEGKENTVTPAAENPERPAWLPEKFNSPEDMAKAYSELEKKQSTGEPEGDPDGEPEGDPDAEATEAANKAVEAAGLDMEALGDKVVKQGDLDEADYEALAKQGITKEMVKSYVDGQKALAGQLVSRMHDTVGGEEAFNGLLEWAGENLTKDEVEAFNNTVDNGSEAALKLALEGLQAKHRAAVGSAPKLVGGKRQASTGDVFRSTAELTEAMRDSRYTTDPAYRADVAAKLNRSAIM